MTSNSSRCRRRLTMPASGWGGLARVVFVVAAYVAFLLAMAALTLSEQWGNWWALW